MLRLTCFLEYWELHFRRFSICGWAAQKMNARMKHGMKRPTNRCIHAWMCLENEHGAGTECNQSDVLVQGTQKQDKTSRKHIWVQQIRAAGTILEAGRASLILFQSVDSTWHTDVVKVMIFWWSHSTEMIPVLSNIVVQIYWIFCYLPVRFQHSLQSSAVDPATLAGELSLPLVDCRKETKLFLYVLFCCKRMQKADKCYWGTRFTDLLHKLIEDLTASCHLLKLADSCFGRR